MKRDVAAIRFVSERYEQLQGLRVVVIGSVFAVSAGAYALAGAPGGDWGLLTTMLIAFGVMAAGVYLAGCYYTVRFGRIVREERSADLWLPVTLSIVMTAGNNVFSLGPLPMPVAFNAGWALWIAIRDWPFRPHYLLGTAACAATLIGVLTIPRFRPHRPVDDALAIMFIGLVYVVIGLLDHRLLTSVMRSQHAEAGLKPCATRDQN